MGRYSVFMLSPCNHVTSTMTLLLAVFQFQEMARSTSVLGARRGGSESGTSFQNEVVDGALSELEGSSISCGHRVYEKCFVCRVISVDVVFFIFIMSNLLCFCVWCLYKPEGSSRGYRWISCTFVCMCVCVCWQHSSPCYIGVYWCSLCRVCSVTACCDRWEVRTW